MENKIQNYNYNSRMQFQPQPQPFTTIYPPPQAYPPYGDVSQMGNQNLNMNTQTQIDVSVATGFGDMFFNMNDPMVAQKNVPIKQDSSMHTAIIVGTVLFIGGIVVGAIGFNKFLVAYSTGLVIGLPYLVYLICAVCLSDIRGYITNLKRFEEYKQTYDGMVKGRGFFRFHIECYHYRTVRTKNGTRREKVVTHTASQMYYPSLSQDVSGNITGIQDITKYVFINYLRKFYFTDSVSQGKFNAQYNSFVSRNRRDEHQEHSHTFDIEGFQEEVGFCALGEGSHNSVLFYLLAFLGLSLPYSCILERSVSRYSINIVKKLTC